LEEVGAPQKLNGEDVETTGRVRDDIVSTVERLLLGPVRGRNEVISSPPLDTYLTGILWPKDLSIPEEEDEQLELKADGADEDQPEDQGISLSSIRRPSSLGITFQINISSGFRVRILGGRYSPQESPGGDTSWTRKDVHLHFDVEAGFPRETHRTRAFHDNDGKRVEDVGLELFLKYRVRDGRAIVTATLINVAEEDMQRRHEIALFQSSLQIESMPGQPFEVVGRSTDAPSGDEDFETNELLYRNVIEYAVGHGVSTDWELCDHSVVMLKTAWLPSQKVSSVSPSGHSRLVQLAESGESPFTGKFLADPSNGQEIRRRLELLAAEYEGWISDRNKELDALNLAPRNRQTADRHLRECASALARMRKGISLLSDKALTAFCLANEAMDMQSRGKWRGADAKPLVWRPFQIAFFLLTLPSLVTPSDSEEREKMDLLWFPTGGGKTEAYLALVAFAIFYRRLTLETSRDSGNVTVLMRYTLRLLTVQQFQRASALICACNILRARRPTELGTEPISIGLYVGQAATPNRVITPDDTTTSAKRAIDDERNGGSPPSTPRLLLRCPLCGETLSAYDYDIDEATRTMSIRCRNMACESAGEELPVHTVDEEIYRVKPSLLLGTVDKFAQLPRNARVGELIGSPIGIPPSLIIQDELHLISGPLGTIAGLYETALDMLCTRGGIRPKIIGSTATIGRAKEQVRALFDRTVAQFPPPGIDADDSFFAVRDEALPDRLYVGISSAGRSPKFTLQAAVAAALQSPKHLECIGAADESDLDPFWTCVLYFNSLRELGGAKVLVRDDVGRTMPFYSRQLGDTLRQLEQQDPPEITSRVSSREIPERLEQLQICLGGDPNKGQPLDTVLASNMISVGVDVPRLGHMIVAGQPKSTSEYIQATSRVGRGIDGVVFVVYNVSRPRDLSHFEHFKSYHSALYRSVEATSVTPWSSRARDRALHAAFVGMIRNTLPGLQDDADAIAFDPDSPDVKRAIEYVVRRCLNATSDVPEPEIRAHVMSIVERWAKRTNAAKLSYWAKINPVTGKPMGLHLMRDMEEVWRDPQVWPTPNSMREVEPSAFFSTWEQDAAAAS
jgi:hypothetical protein